MRTQSSNPISACASDYGSFMLSAQDRQTSHVAAGRHQTRRVARTAAALCSRSQNCSRQSQTVRTRTPRHLQHERGQRASLLQSVLDSVQVWLCTSFTLRSGSHVASYRLVLYHTARFYVIFLLHLIKKPYELPLQFKQV